MKKVVEVIARLGRGGDGELAIQAQDIAARLVGRFEKALVDFRLAIDAAGLDGQGTLPLNPAHQLLPVKHTDKT